MTPRDSNLPGARLATFAQFWPYYLSQHRRLGTRVLHYIGTSAALAIAGAALWRGQPRLIIAALLAGYLPAWLGHLAIEHNRPATLRHPFWSFRADFKMLATALTRRGHGID
jgi:hypothetical protein